MSDDFYPNLRFPNNLVVPLVSCCACWFSWSTKIHHCQTMGLERSFSHWFGVNFQDVTAMTFNDHPNICNNPQDVTIFPTFSNFGCSWAKSSNHPQPLEAKIPRHLSTSASPCWQGTKTMPNFTFTVPCSRLFWWGKSTQEILKFMNQYQFWNGEDLGELVKLCFNKMIVFQKPEVQENKLMIERPLKEWHHQIQ